jgi:hypothetical protein
MDMKAEVIKIINNRIEEFSKIHHHFEADELRKACSSIERLIPPSNFQSKCKELEEEKNFYKQLCVDHSEKLKK